MRKIFNHLSYTLFIGLAILFANCSKDNSGDDIIPEPEPSPEVTPSTSEQLNCIIPEGVERLEYLFDQNYMPEIHVEVTLEEWNKLLNLYDLNHDTDEYVVCSATLKRGDDSFSVSNMGIRLKGGTSRRRPEGSEGQPHNSSKNTWRQFHFGLNFRKYVKDDEHTIMGMRKLNFRFNNNEPSYVREMYCYDLFRRAGVWTAINDVFCRAWIHIEGDASEIYLGVYGMTEPIDDEYIKIRKDLFGKKGGNLWKAGDGAGLTSINKKFVVDGGDRDAQYTLKTNEEDFDNAKTQICNFITKLNSLEGQEFHDWISSVCDVPFLLKTYAVSVACGAWDDYWNNSKNYYIYFTTKDPNDYKFFYIPYDFDMTLGETKVRGNLSDTGRQDPYNWGLKKNPLIQKLMAFDDFKEIYKKELKNLVTPENKLFIYPYSIQRIRRWMDMVSPFVKNDTGEYGEVSDNTASWSTIKYKLLEDSKMNYFQVKTETINNLK